jgi:hypothetical protein
MAPYSWQKLHVDWSSLLFVSQFCWKCAKVKLAIVFVQMFSTERRVGTTRVIPHFIHRPPTVATLAGDYYKIHGPKNSGCKNHSSFYIEILNKYWKVYRMGFFILKKFILFRKKKFMNQLFYHEKVPFLEGSGKG